MSDTDRIWSKVRVVAWGGKGEGVGGGEGRGGGGGGDDGDYPPRKID